MSKNIYQSWNLKLAYFSRQNSGLQRCLCPNPQNQWIFLGYVAIKVADGIKLADQLILKWEDVLNYPGGSNLTKMPLKTEKRGRNIKS